jgi:hypothetical protein
VAHSVSSGTDDYFRVRVSAPSGWTTLLDERGAAADRSAAWTSLALDLTPWAGQPIRIQIEAADVGRASLFEAAVDDVRITRD